MDNKRVIDSKSKNGGIRKVLCPKCKNLLREPTDIPLYRCGICNTVLQAKHYKGPPVHVPQGSTGECSNDTSQVKDKVPVNGRDHPDSNFRRNERDKSDDGEKKVVPSEQLREREVMSTGALEKSSLSGSDVVQHVSIGEPSQTEPTEGELQVDGHVHDAAERSKGPPVHVFHSSTGTSSNGTSPVKDEVPINDRDHPDTHFKRNEMDKSAAEKGKEVAVSREQLQESTGMNTSGLEKSSLLVSDGGQHANLEKDPPQMDPTEGELEMKDHMHDAADHYKGAPGHVCHSSTGTSSNGTSPAKDDAPINDRDHPDSNIEGNEIDKSDSEKGKEVTAVSSEQLQESTEMDTGGNGKSSLSVSDVAVVQHVNLEREPAEGELEMDDHMYDAAKHDEDPPVHVCHSLTGACSNGTSPVKDKVPINDGDHPDSSFKRNEIDRSNGVKGKEVAESSEQLQENTLMDVRGLGKGSLPESDMAQHVNLEGLPPHTEPTEGELEVDDLTNKGSSILEASDFERRHFHSSSGRNGPERPESIPSDMKILSDGSKIDQHMRDALSEKSSYFEIDVSQSGGDLFPSHGSSPTLSINFSSKDEVLDDGTRQVDGPEHSHPPSSSPGHHREMENHGSGEVSPSLDIVKTLSLGSPEAENARSDLVEGSSITRDSEMTAPKETDLEVSDGHFPSSLCRRDMEESRETSLDQARERRSLQVGHDLKALRSSASSSNEPSSRNPPWERRPSILSADFSSMQNWIESEREKLLRSLSVLSDSKELDRERMEVLNKIDELRNLLESHAPTEDWSAIPSMEDRKHHSRFTTSGAEQENYRLPPPSSRHPSAFESRSTVSDENQFLHWPQTPRDILDGVPYSRHQFQPATLCIHRNYRTLCHICCQHSGDDVSSCNSYSRGLKKENFHRGERDHDSKHYCRPILGAAHFLACYECQSVLQMPEDFNFLSSRYKHLRCGACLKTLGFFVSGGKQIVPWPSEAKQSPEMGVGRDSQRGRVSPSDEEQQLQSLSETHSKEEVVEGRSRSRKGNQRPLHRLMGYFSATDILYQEKN